MEEKDKKDQMTDHPSDEEVLEAEVEQIEDQLTEEEVKDNTAEEELRQSLLRLQADFSNYRKRTDREREQRVQMANEDLVMSLLPLLDDFDRAMASGDPDNEFVKGIGLIVESFKQILKKEGLDVIESDDCAFDPNLHHAVMVEKKEGVKSNTVIETLQKGYRLKDKVIRCAMVKVSE